jgi:prepilin peptidase CpaA
VHPTSIIFIAFIGIFTLVAAVCDFRTKKLPNLLTVPAFLAAIVFHVTVGALEGGFSGSMKGLGFAMGGFGVGFGILLVLWLIGGGGAGDVKLMGALGAWFGATQTFVLFLVSVVFVLVLSVGAMGWAMFTKGAWNAKRKYLSTDSSASGPQTHEQKMQNKVRRRLLPFGVPVAMAAWVLLWTMWK